MYFWSLKSLREDLRGNDSSDTMAWPYFCGFLVLMAVSDIAMLGERGKPIQDSDRWAVWISAILSIVGAYYAFRKNGGKTGRRFFNRFFPLAWVVGFRTLMLFVPFLIVIGLIFSPRDIEILVHWIDLAMSPALVWIYYRVGQEVGAVAAHDRPLSAAN